MAYVVRTKVPPLETIDRTEVTFLTMVETDRVEKGTRSISIPNMNAQISKLTLVSGTAQEPQQLL